MSARVAQTRAAQARSAQARGRSAGAPRRTASSLLLGLAGCSLITALLVLILPRFQHWFVIPVALCGALAATDAIDWVRGRFDVFDPVGVLGLFGVYFFFAAPLLHVYWERWISTAYWLALVPPPADWRPWLGWMAWLDVAGLVVYRYVRERFVRAGPLPRAEQRPLWRLAPARFGPVLLLAIGLTTLAQVLVYLAFGGIGGYISAFEREARESFAGMGWVFLFSESTPVLLLFGFAAAAAQRGRKVPWLTIALVLAAFFALRLIFGGLRGSRSNTIWALFWGVGVIHLWVRPIPKRVIAAGIAFLLTFMYLYGFYKSVGRDALRALEGEDARTALVEETGRSFEAMLLADLGRSDIQAFILYRQTERDVGMVDARGRTYVGALALLVPQAIWPGRPPTKQKEGTELFYGQGSYVPGRSYVSYVYGLAGEAMLNFGPWSVPVAFALLGVLVGGLHRRMRTYAPGDARQLMVPFLVNLCIIALVSDSDNVVFTLVKNGAVPFLVILLGSNRLVRRHAEPSHADAARTDAVRADAVRADAVRADAARADAAPGHGL
jgi:hypothetical protein